MLYFYIHPCEWKWLYSLKKYTSLHRAAQSTKILKMKTLIVFLILVLSFNGLGADVKFAFQQATDKDKMVYVKNKDRNQRVLFINEKCINCFRSLARLKRKIIDSRIIVVSSTNNINFLKNLVTKNAPDVKNLIHYDPGRRFSKELDLENVNFSYVLFNKGRYKKANSSAQTVAEPPF